MGVLLEQRTQRVAKDHVHLLNSSGARRRYEDAVVHQPGDPAATIAGKSHRHGAVTEIPAGLLPERPKSTTQSEDDPALREYNAYLAELAEKPDNDDRTAT